MEERKKDKKKLRKEDRKEECGKKNDQKQKLYIADDV